jgi:hypothetical protein
MLAYLKNLFKPKQANAAMAWALLQNKAGKQASNQDKLAYWLYATPVHLVLQRDTFSLAAPVPLGLDANEVDALTTALNQHFTSDGLAFIWHENSWFLSLQTNPQISTTAPQIAINKDISAYLPAGEGATKWASFSNEIQMLLFEHPVNLTREAKRLPVINSIWCYGGGQIL